MGRKKRQLRIKVHGDRRTNADARRMARAIIRLATEQGLSEAQALVDDLDAREAQRRIELTRARKAEHQPEEQAEAS